MQRLRQRLLMEILVSSPPAGGLRQAAESEVQELRKTVPLAGFAEQTFEVRVRGGAQVRVFRLRTKVSSQAVAHISPETIPLSNGASILVTAESKRDHNRVNYDAPFTCYKCGKRYTWTDSLTRHLREGCGKLPRHKCTLCGRKFKRRDYLLRHENNVHKLE